MADALDALIEEHGGEVEDQPPSTPAAPKPVDLDAAIKQFGGVDEPPQAQPAQAQSPQDFDALLKQFGGEEEPAAPPPAVSAAVPGTATPTAPPLPPNASLFERAKATVGHLLERAGQGDAENAFGEIAAPAATAVLKSPVTGAKQAAKGFSEIAQAVPVVPPIEVQAYKAVHGEKPFTLKPTDVEGVKSGVSDIIEGVGTMATIPTIAAGIANPVAVGRVLVSTFLAGGAAKTVAKYAGASPSTQRFMEDVAAGAVALGVTANEVGKLTGDGLAKLAERGKAARAAADADAAAAHQGFVNAKPTPGVRTDRALPSNTPLPEAPLEAVPIKPTPSSTKPLDLTPEARQQAIEVLQDEEATADEKQTATVALRRSGLSDAAIAQAVEPQAAMTAQPIDKMPSTDDVDEAIEAHGGVVETPKAPSGGLMGLSIPELEARVTDARKAGKNDVGAELELQKQRDAVEAKTGKPVGPVSKVAEKAPEKPAATFRFYQPIYEGDALINTPMYDIPTDEGRPTTVSAKTAEARGFAVPETPSFEDWKANRGKPPVAAVAKTEDHEKVAQDAFDVISAKHPSWEVVGTDDDGKWVAERTDVSDGRRGFGDSRKEQQTPKAVQAQLDILNALPEGVVERVLNSPDRTAPKVDEKPQSIEATAQNVPPSSTGSPAVAYNKDRHSIEVKFEKKPSPETLSALKGAGFKWAKTNRLWYDALPKGVAPETHLESIKKLLGQTNEKWPVQKKTVTMPVEDLARLHRGQTLEQYVKEDRPASFEPLLENIRKNGITDPIVVEVDKSGAPTVIVDGRHRLRAAQVLGMTDVPVKVVTREEAIEIEAAQLKKPVTPQVEAPAGSTPLGLKHDWEPTTAEDRITLYRGEDVDGKSVAGGRNFTTDEDRARRYAGKDGRVVAVDVSKSYLETNTPPETSAQGVYRVSKEIADEATPKEEVKTAAKKLSDYKPGEEVIYTNADGDEVRGTVLDPPLTGEKDKLRVDLETTKQGAGAAYDRVYPQEGDVRPAEKIHTYSSTQVDLDGALRDKVLALGKKIPKPDLAEKGLETDPHFTVKFGLHALGREEITATFKDVDPFDVTIGEAGYFHTDDGDELFVKVDSPELRALNEKISALPNSDEHARYVPHITIAYLKPGKGKAYVEKPLFDSLKRETFHVGAVTTSLATGKRWVTPLVDKETRQQLAQNAKEPTPETEELPETAEERKVEEADEEQGRGGAGTRQLPEPRGGAPDAERADGEGPLAEVSAEDVEGAGEAEGRPRPRGAKGGLADRVPRGTGAGAGSEVEHVAGGGDVSQSVDVPPSGATHYPGHKAPDYDLDVDRLETIIGRGPVVRAEDNLRAIQLVKQLATEERYATPDEQAVLAKYVGWGASDMAHRLNDYPRTEWSANEKRIWQELQDTLTPEERKGLLASTPYAHFTFRLFQPMWDALVNAGFGGGRVLEPSIGTGHAFGLMPPDIRAESTLNGVEIEPITAAITHHLYPSARIQPVGYEQARIARGTQDVIIGNPPFGDFGVKDARMPEIATRRIHNYFFAKALEHLRPGGLLMFVATHYAMDSIEASGLRRYLMERAHFVGAVRLPSSAFGKSAKTEVITDIIVLKKLREGEKATPLNAEAFIESPRSEDLSTTDYRGKPKNVYRSQWYDEHPELILGTETSEGTMYGAGGYNVESEDTPDQLMAKLGDALKAILPSGAYEPAVRVAESETPAIVEKGTYKPGELRVGANGKTIVKVDKHGELSDVTPTDKNGHPNKKAVDRLKGMIAIRDARNTAIAVMRDKASTDAQVKKAQLDLNRAYDTFVKPTSDRPDYLNNLTNKRLFKDDPESANLLALERVEPKATLSVSPKDGKKVLRLSYTVVGKHDIFTKRTVGATSQITHVDTPRDALFASLGLQARIDWPYMARLHGSSPEHLQEALKSEGLVFEQPDGSFMLADEYLSGDVVSKLEDVEAEHDPKRFATNLTALKGIQPPPKTSEDVMAGLVGIGLGSHWVPPSDLETFVAEQLGVQKNNVRYSLLSTSTLTRWDGKATDAAVGAGSRHALIVKYDGGAKTYGFLDLVNDTLNLKRPTLGHWEGSGKDRYWVREPQAELAAAANQELLRQAWQSFVLQHEEVLGRLLDIFNTRFNRTVAREYDGAHMQFPGMAQLTNDRGDVLQLHPHQKNGIYRILASGNTLLAHDVGAGKTIECIAAAMEMRRTGRATKPMITVPTYLLSQWREDIIRLYPNARVLAFDDKDLSKDKRQQAMARIAHGDWDIVLVPHSSFGLLKVSDQRMVDVMNEWITELESAITDAQKADTKEFEKQKKRIQDKVDAKLKSLEDEKKDNSLTWEQLGVDALFVDEAQVGKNLFYFTKINNLRGLSRSESDRALDLFVKIRDINEQSNFRNVVLATATPVMNTIGEIYTMQRYLQPQTLRENGVESFDNWYAMFAKALPTTERQPDGNYKEVMRLREYSNLPLLSKMMREVMDYIGWEDMPYLKLPKIKGGKINIIETEPHPMNAQAMAWFADRMIRLKETPPHINRQGEYIAPERLDMLTGQPTGKPDNILTVMTDAKKAAIDMRLIVGNRATDYAGSRIQVAADKMADYYKRSKENKGVGLVFLDMGTPKEPPPLTFLAGVTTEDETEGALDEEAVEGDEDTPDDDSAFNLYDDLKANLIKRGVPAHEIAYIHQAKNAAERLALFQAANEGKIRFVFASTDKGGVGMNIQTRLGAMFEIDAPRAQRPGDLRQRMGRAIRQGNYYYDWGGVEMYRFVTKGTTDEWLWGLLTTKDYQLRKFYRGEVGSLTEDDPSTMSLEEAQIRATGDPRGVELTELKGKMARLEAQAMAGELAVSAAHGTIAKETPRLASWERDLKDLLAWLPKYAPLRGDKFSIEIQGKTYAKREDANTAMMAALAKLLPKAPTRTSQYAQKTAPLVEMGTIGGLKVYAQEASYFQTVELKGKGKAVESMTQPVFGVVLHLDADALGLGSLDGGDVWSTDRSKPFGEGRNIITSLVNAYEKIPTEERLFEEAIKKSEDAIEQSKRVLSNPPASVAALITARARVQAIETELKAESAGKEAARVEAKQELARKVKEEGGEEPPKSKKTHPMLTEDEGAVRAALQSANATVGASKAAIVTAFGEPESMDNLVRHGMRTWRQRMAEVEQRHKHAVFALKKMEGAFDRLAAGADGDKTDPRVQAVRERILKIADALEDPEETGERVPEELQAWADVRNELFELEKAKQDALGVGLAWRDYYLGHIWQQAENQHGGLKSLIAWMRGGKRPIEGPKTYRKHRTIPTTRAGVEEFGKELEDWNLVRVDIAKLMEMRKFTAAATWLERDLKPSGAARFVSALGKVPKDMKVLPGRFFEVWAPPTVEVHEAFDYALMHGLESMLDSLGVPYTRIPDAKKAWGTTEIDEATGAMVVNAKFGGPVDVLMHELGHVLDHRYQLQALFNEPQLQDELTALAKLREENAPRGGDFSEYVQRAPEKIANLIHAYLYVPERLKQVAPQVADRLGEFIESVPELAEAMPDLQNMRSLVMGQRSTEKRLPGPVLVGKYYAPPALAKAAERYLQPGLGVHPAWRFLRWPVNALVQWTLAWPLFHFFTVTKAAMADEGAQGLQSLMAGNPLRGIAKVALTPLGPLLAGISGQKVQDIYKNSPDAMAGAIIDEVQTLVMGGGRAMPSAEYSNRQMKAFMRNIRTAHGAWEHQLPKTAAGAALKAAFHLVPAAVEAAAWLIMDKYVPMIKAGAITRGIATDIANLPGTPTPETIRAIATKRVNQADALYGQVIWDNMALHVNRAVMNAMQMLIMAPGWRGGALVIALRAAVDPVWRLKNREKYTLSGGGAGGGGKKPPKGGKAEKDPVGDDGVPPYVHEPWFASYLALFVMIAVVGAAWAELWQLAHGAGHVQSPKDVAAPRDGTKDADGKAHRDRFPGYEAIFYEMLRHLPFSALQYALGGESPLPRMVTEWYHNENAFGGPIWDPGDTIGNQLAQYARYLRSELKPIVVSSLQRAETPEQKRRAILYSSTPASRAITDTPAEALMRQYAPPRRLTQDDVEKLDLKRLVRAGTPEEAEAAITSGNLSPREILNAIESGAVGTSSKELRFKQLPYDKALKVYEIASESERGVFFPILVERLDTALENAAPNALQGLIDRFNHAMDLPVGVATSE